MDTPLRMVREKMGRTKAEVARACKVDPSNYAKIEENGRTSRETARRIAAYFGPGVITEQQILYPEDYSPREEQEAKAS